MTNTIIPMILLVVLSTTYSFSQNDQYINATLNRDNFSNNILIHNLGGGTSYVSFGDVDMLDANGSIIKLFEYQREEDFELIFQIEKEVQNDFSFSCGSFSNPTSPEYYSFQFEQGSCSVLINGTSISSFDYDSEGIFKIYKCGVYMTFYYDEEIKYSSPIIPELLVFSHYMNVSTSIDTDLFMATNLIEEECIPPYDSKLYFSMKLAYPKNIARTVDGLLNVSFIQKYHVPEDEISTIKIFDSDRLNNTAVNTPLVTMDLDKTYGPNYISIEIDELETELQPDKIYTLEINNINKEKTYYLKFKL
ncbi:MAG: hypothetical protein P1U56_01835 [Saprospiraceae bacterium]|nr:hypothetical protein [Saprospiraceae bacterium]